MLLILLHVNLVRPESKSRVRHKLHTLKFLLSVLGMSFALHDAKRAGAKCEPHPSHVQRIFLTSTFGSQPCRSSKYIHRHRAGYRRTSRQVDAIWMDIDALQNSISVVASVLTETGALPIISQHARARITSSWRLLPSHLVPCGHLHTRHIPLPTCRPKCSTCQRNLPQLNWKQSRYSPMSSRD
jgi:hypothetical protein